MILHRVGGYTDEQGNQTLGGPIAERFVGVYSGRINDESDLGRVWKAQALVEILDGKQRGPKPALSLPSP